MTYTVNTFNAVLDDAAWIGQQTGTFQYKVYSGATGIYKGLIHPIRSGARLSFDSTRTLKRTLTYALGVDDTAFTDPVSDRVVLSMIVPNVGTFPLGTYIYTDQTTSVFQGRPMASYSLSDLMYKVDQPITAGVNGIALNQSSTVQVFGTALRGLGITYDVAYSPFPLAQSWSVGTNRGQILDAIALGGDYFSPWFDNNGVLRMIRSFNPANSLVDFDWDANKAVLQQSIGQTTNLLTAPNQFTVISNSSTSSVTNTSTGASRGIVATVNIPDSAPNSIAKRGFAVPLIVQAQVNNNAAAIGMAVGLANRSTIVETVTLSTNVDPRHDGYNVIKWNGSKWLELGWEIDLEGLTMTHTLRKAYA